MIAYGKMKRSSMKSVTENKSNSQLSRETVGNLTGSKHGITHDKNCEAKRN